MKEYNYTWFNKIKALYSHKDKKYFKLDIVTTSCKDCSIYPLTLKCPEKYNTKEIPSNNSFLTCSSEAYTVWKEIPGIIIVSSLFDI